jgi:hypothetical protein
MLDSAMYGSIKDDIDERRVGTRQLSTKAMQQYRRISHSCLVRRAQWIPRAAAPARPQRVDRALA